MRGKMTGTHFDKYTHLATNEDEVTFIEFELLLWRSSAAFMRWQVDASNCISKFEMTPYDLAIVHIIRLKERPKTVIDIAKLLNRDDLPNISYSIRKLISYGLIRKFKEKANSKIKTKKQASYEITELGIKETDAFQEVKKNILLEKIKELVEGGFDFKPVIKALSIMTGVYDEAGRIATVYQANQ
jgi:predicted MarR family transcription regulator